MDTAIGWPDDIGEQMRHPTSSQAGRGRSAGAQAPVGRCRRAAAYRPAYGPAT